MITNPVLTQNDGKRNLSQKCRFATRFRQTVISNPLLTQNEAERNLYQNHRFRSRFRQTVITNPFLTQNDSKTHFDAKPSFWRKSDKQPSINTT